MVLIETRHMPNGEMLDIQYQSPKELTKLSNKIFWAASKIPEGSPSYPQAQIVLDQLEAFSQGSDVSLDGIAITDVLKAARLINLPREN